MELKLKKKKNMRKAFDIVKASKLPKFNHKKLKYLKKLGFVKDNIKEKIDIIIRNKLNSFLSINL
jgi:hypothetical protein